MDREYLYIGIAVFGGLRYIIATIIKHIRLIIKREINKQFNTLNQHILVSEAKYNELTRRLELLEKL